MEKFMRTELLIGKENLKKIQELKIAIFGIGGVGSYVAEGIARLGVTNIVLIDKDKIDISNINRQIHATTKTIGKSKVEEMKKRILEINPEANVVIYKNIYNKETAEELLQGNYDYVIDAIDMVTSKIDLIKRCKEKNIKIISSMGTGNKLDPTKLEICDIYKTSVCPLARVMRRELKKNGIKKLKVLYSKEEVIKTNNDGIIGSCSFVPSVGGLIIVSEIVKQIMNEKKNDKL
ncbi:MAG: tRNA cyclic N6-threonylcarbamoyladenosine(37) synthase TcdA [Fusobacteriia bacterium 4572_132]|nr:MAG: tRNA cyclic N6-threonylcarbamoyladenosine(37) synthase TcdA [Fusobacteriia bacterium 4572_132]